MRVTLVYLSFVVIISLFSCANKDRIASELVTAITQNDFNTVEKLLKKGANPNYIPKGVKISYLLLSAQSGYVEISNMLLKKGAQVNFEDKDGNNALMLSIMCSKSKEVQKSLLENGINLWHKNHEEQTVFQMAPSSNDTGFFHIIIENYMGKISTDSILSLFVPTAKNAENRNFLLSAYSLLDSANRIIFAKNYGIPYPEEQRSDMPTGSKSIRTNYASILIAHSDEMYEYNVSVNGILIGKYKCMGLDEKKTYSTACGEDVVVLEVSPGGNVCEVNYLILAIDETTIWKSDIIEMCIYARRISYNEEPGEKTPSCNVTLDFSAVSYVYSSKSVKKTEPTLPEGAQKIKATFLTLELKGSAMYYFKNATGQTLMFELDQEYVGPDLNEFTKYQGREFLIAYITRKTVYDADNIVKTNYLLAASIQ